MLPAPFRLISPLTQRAYIFFGEGKTFKPLLLFFGFPGSSRCHTSEHSQPWRLREPCGVAEVTALLPRTPSHCSSECHCSQTLYQAYCALLKTLRPLYGSQWCLIDALKYTNKRSPAKGQGLEEGGLETELDAAS